ncbi:MAG TPA: SRPBCC family protein [Pseudonocardiaceae bacterium]|nr:SRPBCC family protein [Pseudonocardiaceae bacterium]
MDLGTYIEHEGRPAVRFERAYPHPVSRLWAAITEPGDLSHWFPATVSIRRPDVGGTIEFTGDPNAEPTAGTILVFDPPTRLAYTWGADELHFHLKPNGDNACTLTLIDVLESRDAAARNAAGWTVCLLELDHHIAGEPTKGPHSDTAEPWQPLYDSYVAAGMPAGAPIPGVTA